LFESSIRIIPRLDIKSGNLIKGINLEGLRVVGNPFDAAINYYLTGADELFFHDAVASLYNQNHLGDLLEKITDKVFIPVTVGGGIRSLEDAIYLFERGADKIALNTAFVLDPSLISKLSNHFGSQSVVGSIEAKKISETRWEIFTESGRQTTGIEIKKWMETLIEEGVGEILITSIDKEGMRKGFDLDLAKYLNDHYQVPIIFGGGFKEPNDLLRLKKEFSFEGITVADYLHYKRGSIGEIKSFAKNYNLNIREIS
tara:strand:- start:658 stop:1428 length:771 start_codon:yes stop_codon:yes gene_type:complete